MVDPNVGWGRGWSAHNTSEFGGDHGRVPMSADANFIGEAFDEDGGDEGMKRKKKSSRNADADEENRRGWHFWFRRRGRQRLGQIAF